MNVFTKNIKKKLFKIMKRKYEYYFIKNIRIVDISFETKKSV